MPRPLPDRAVFIVVLAELFGTSLWFSANAAADGLVREWNLVPEQIGQLTNAVQAGFILGTVTSSLLGLSDRYSASRIFGLCAILGALSNAAFALVAGNIWEASCYRFATGLCLAGIYPIGMKLIVGWAPHKAPLALGWLVGMLTLGTAAPQAVRALSGSVDWRLPILAASVAACAGGLIVVSLGDGPYSRRASVSVGGAFRDTLSVFKLPRYRAAALGYFGHMWELYAFWTLIPFLVAELQPEASARFRAGLTFSIIGIGGLGCIVSGLASRRLGSGRVAGSALLGSGLCCAALPLMAILPSSLRIAMLLLWGFLVVADSPQFSALSASACPPEKVGAALAIQNGLGFSLSAVSISISTHVWPELGPSVSWLLLPGPILGLIWMRKLFLPEPAIVVG